MEDLFLNLAKWCNRFGAVYNLCYQYDVYEFAIRLTDCGTIGSVDLSDLLDFFRNHSENWCASVRFDKDCLRITYAKVQLL